MLLIWLGVKVVSWIVQHQKYTYLVFGEYGRCHCSAQGGWCAPSWEWGQENGRKYLTEM